MRSAPSSALGASSSTRDRPAVLAWTAWMSTVVSGLRSRPFEVHLIGPYAWWWRSRQSVDLRFAAARGSEASGQSVWAVTVRLTAAVRVATKATRRWADGAAATLPPSQRSSNPPRRLSVNLGYSCDDTVIASSETGPMYPPAVDTRRPLGLLESFGDGLAVGPRRHRRQTSRASPRPSGRRPARISCHVPSPSCGHAEQTVRRNQGRGRSTLVRER